MAPKGDSHNWDGSKWEVMFTQLSIFSTLPLQTPEIGKSSSGNNWRYSMTAFNTIKIVESAGIGLVFGLRYNTLYSDSVERLRD